MKKAPKKQRKGKKQKISYKQIGAFLKSSGELKGFQECRGESSLQQVSSFLDGEYPDKNIKAFFKSLLFEESQNPKFCAAHVAWEVYFSRMKARSKIPRTQKSKKKLTKLAEHLYWFYSCLPPNNFISDIIRMVVDEHDAIDGLLKRGRKKETERAKHLRNLILYLQIECGYSPDAAYCVLADKLCVLEGEKKQEAMRARLRSLITPAMKLVEKNLPKNLSKKRA